MNPETDGLERRIDFRVSRKTDKALTRAARERGVSKSDLAREAVRRMLARQSFDRICATVQPYAEKLGLYTDEDVMRFIKKK